MIKFKFDEGKRGEGVTGWTFLAIKQAPQVELEKKKSFVWC